MVNAQPRNFPLCDMPHHQLVNDPKDFGFFDSDTREGVNVKKAPIIDFMKSCFPIGQAISLRFEQGMQFIKALRMAWLSIYQTYDLPDVIQNSGRRTDESK